MARAVVQRLRGLVPYGRALELQERLAAGLRAGERPAAGGAVGTVLVLQHPPVYTVGKRGPGGDLMEGEAALRAAGAEVFRTRRGGQVTFHGPGQVVVYPVVDLRALPGRVGARRWVEGLEDTMVGACRAHGVAARGRVPGRTGVWVGDWKIGAIGVQIRGGVSTHGLAFNVAPDLARFAAIVPCGGHGAGITSLAREVGRTVPRREAEDGLLAAFAETFRIKLEEE